MKQIEYSFNPVLIWKRFWEFRGLISELVKRELRQQYNGSFLGGIWTVLVPLIMLAIYTFVFSVILKTRWFASDDPTPPGEFALIIFAGLVPFTVFSTITGRAPILIIQVPSYVKKVVFPLEILPIVALGTAILNSFITAGLVILGNLILLHSFSVTLFLLPLAYLPLILLCAGIGLLLASLGVYIRDLNQAIGLIVQIMFFVTPIFYPVSRVPKELMFIYVLNPMVEIVENFRRVLLWSQPLDWWPWIIWTIITSIIFTLSYVWFMKIKKGFADVM